MRKSIWLVAFLIDAVLELVTNLFSLPILHWITKPLLMVFLVGYFIALTKSFKVSLKSTIIIALVMSWFGDVLLMFQELDPLFFILGLVSFLLAHVAYIFGFSKLKTTLPKVNSSLVVLLLFIYSAGLVYLLWPGLGDMLIPVIVYAIVLTTMGIMGIIKNHTQNLLVSLGVLLFVASDSLLALNKFLNPFTYSGFFTMATYIAAQFLITEGVARRILSTGK